MKKLNFFFLFFAGPLALMSQSGALPDVNVRNLDGTLVSAADFVQRGKPAVVLFLDDMGYRNMDLVEELGSNLLRNHGSSISIIAVFNDMNGGLQLVRSFFSEGEETLSACLDVNGELRLALGISSDSQILLYDEEGQLKNRLLAMDQHSSDVYAMEISKSLCQKSCSNFAYLSPGH
jgi:hypothetical protein